MALTSGAKKFLGLLATVAVVGGGIYGFKSGLIGVPKSADPAPIEVQVQAPEPVQAPVQVQAPAPAPAPVQLQQAEQAPAPIQAADPSTNRGLAAVLGAGRK